MSQDRASALEPTSDSPESIGLELREALHTVRIQSLSLHDADGDVLWLSEGVLGPDEHGAVLDAMGSQNLEPGGSVVERPLGDGRSAWLLPARTNSGDVVGVAMLIQEAEVASPTLKTKLSDPRLQMALARLAARQQSLTDSRPALKLDAVEIDAVEIADSRFDGADGLELEPDDGFVRSTSTNAGSTNAASTDAASTEVASTAAASTDAAVIAPGPNRQELILVVQRLLRLRPGGRTRRYDVLPRSAKEPTRAARPDALAPAMAAFGSPGEVDRFALSELIAWLGQHRRVWESEPISFSIHVARSTLPDQGFLPLAAALFEQWKVPPGIVGFELSERDCIEASGQVRAFIETCEKLGCFIGLDDFLLNSAAVPFLGSPALRLIKIDSRLTSSAIKVKLSQALVIAIAHAARVLGVHCVAKRIDSRTMAQWLAENGVDYAEGHALEQLLTLDSLLPAAPRGV